MLAFDLRTPCYTCHEAPQDFMEEFPQLQDGVEEYRTIRDALLAEASDLGLEEGDIYNWLVDQALSLPTHTDSGGEEGAALVLKDQFRVLFEKFRIGKTYYTYSDPADGKLTRTEVVRCTHCHEDDGSGSEMSRAFVSKMHELTALSAAAERSLLKARRAGIETREAEFEVSQAVDSQIALAALIHTFQEEGAFMDRQEQGLEHVRAALEAGKAAQTELRNRRTGLVVSLVVILFVLVGLSIKIREISRREAESREK
jgi:cytochrome c553